MTIEATDLHFLFLASLVADETIASLDHGDLRIIGYLSTQDDGAPVGTLARAVRVPQSSLTRMADKLWRLGMIQRKTDNEDGRSRRIRLTSEGLAVNAKVAHLYRKPPAFWLPAKPEKEEKPEKKKAAGQPALRKRRKSRATPAKRR